jgi:hypothetical protein
MSWAGNRGSMGYSGNELPIVMKMIDLWNELDEMDYTGKDKPLPEHLSKLQDAISLTRKCLQENPPKKDDTIKDLKIKNPVFEMRENCSYLIGGDIVLENGLIIGKVDKINPHSIGTTGKMGIVG